MGKEEREVGEKMMEGKVNGRRGRGEGGEKGEEMREGGGERGRRER